MSGDSCPADAPSERTSGSLGVWDAASLIVGIVIGASLFRVPADVFGHVPGAASGLMLWLLGGALSLAGALCYCELATAFPRMGGDYVYLSRAYGRWMGFLFGWMRFTVIIPANIGAMAFIFAEHARRLAGWNSDRNAAIALAAIAGLAVLNLGGVALGKGVQNALTILKLAGLTAIVAAGISLAAGGEAAPAAADSSPSINYGLALVFILYAYGGWSDASFVASEVRDVRRNVPRALFLGLGTITAFYLFVNWAYVAGLGLHGVRASATPAAELLQRSWGRSGEIGVIVIVMLSTLGAINGMIFSGARLTVALGAQHRLFALLGSSGGQRNPWRAVLAIGAAAGLLVWLVGTEPGMRALAGLVAPFGLREFRWSAGEEGFNTLVTGTAPTFWIFFCLTSAAVPLLRRREPHLERPFRCVSPLMPLVFGGTSLFMLWSSAAYAGSLGWLGAVLLLLGGGLYAALERRGRHGPDGDAP